MYKQAGNELPIITNDKKGKTPLVWIKMTNLLPNSLECKLKMNRRRRKMMSKKTDEQLLNKTV
jgi:hypothetical protein